MNTATVRNAPYSIGGIDFEVALSAGPRIVRARSGPSPDFMAKLGDEGIRHPAIGFFPFIGGHRLWRSPEMPAISYVPDTDPIEVQDVENGIRLVGPPDGEGIIKRISLRDEDGVAVLRHTLINEGPTAVRTAPWAITQVPPGGTAYLPFANEPIDGDGLLPNRNLVLWPYTDFDAPEISCTVSGITVEASTREAKMKVGTANRLGWIAYLLDGFLLVKWSKLHDDRLAYPDMGASLQCYRDERFLEIETVAPLGEIVPGQAVTHKEIWKIIELDGRPIAEVLDGLPAIPEGARL